MTGYERVHRELKQRRGTAAGRPCAAPGCEQPAAEWTLVGDEGTLRFDEDTRGRRIRYSTDLADYQRCCVRHNRQLDNGGDWELCPHGHPRVVWGTTSNGTCRGCRRAFDRERSGRRRAYWRERSRRKRAAAASSTKTLHAEGVQ